MISTRLYQMGAVGAFTGLGLLALMGSTTAVGRAAARTRGLERECAHALGWAQAAPQLDQALTRWDPHQASGEPRIPSTWATARLQQAITLAGVHVLHLQPVTAPRPLRRGPSEPDSRVSMTVTVLGTAPQVATLLQTLPQWLPGVTLEHLELVAQERGIESRLALTVLRPPADGAAS